MMAGDAVQQWHEAAVPATLDAKLERDGGPTGTVFRHEDFTQDDLLHGLLIRTLDAEQFEGSARDLIARLRDRVEHLEDDVRRLESTAARWESEASKLRAENARLRARASLRQATGDGSEAAVRAPSAAPPHAPSARRS